MESVNTNEELEEESWETEENWKTEESSNVKTAEKSHTPEKSSIYSSYKLKSETTVPRATLQTAAGPMYERHYEREMKVAMPTSIPSLPSIKQVKKYSTNNDWNEETLNTLLTWKEDIAKSSFIYGQLLSDKESKFQVVLVLTLVLSTFMTILSGISVALSSLEIDVKWVIFTFNLILLLASGLVTALNGIVKVFSWDDQIKTLTKIIEKLDNQWFIFETELSIPAEQRQNAKDFIKRADGDYMHLMQICPHIGLDNYVKANISYQERLSQNLIWQHQFNKRMEEQLK